MVLTPPLLPNTVRQSETGSPEGAAGPTGEVSTAQLSDAIAGTSNNTNGVATLSETYGDPVVQALIDKVNEHLLAGRR